MAIGMTYEQYWYGDPLMVRAFYKAEQLRKEQLNEEAWLFGAYAYKAFQSALSVSDFFRPKGKKPDRYPESPVPLKKQESKEDKEKEAELERLRLVAYLNQVRDTRKSKE